MHRVFLISLLLAIAGTGIAQPMGDAAIPAPVLIEEQTPGTGTPPQGQTQALPAPTLIEETVAQPPATDPQPPVSEHDSLELLAIPRETVDQPSLPAPVLIPEPLVKDEPMQPNPLVLEDLPLDTTKEDKAPAAAADEEAASAKASDPVAIRQHLDWLLEKAQAAMQARRLTTPKNDSAAEYYNQVLQLDPQNDAAAAGKKEITDTYVRWGHAALKRGQLQRARTFRDRAESVIPGSAFDLGNAIYKAEKQPAARSRSNTRTAKRSAKPRDPSLKEAWRDMIELRQPARSLGAEDILGQ